VFFHDPHALREENPSAKENPPAKQMGSKKSGRRDYIRMFFKENPASQSTAFKPDESHHFHFGADTASAL